MDMPPYKAIVGNIAILIRAVFVTFALIELIGNKTK